MAKVCPSCGAKNDDNAIACSSCGSILVDDDSSSGFSKPSWGTESVTQPSSTSYTASSSTASTLGAPMVSIKAPLIQSSSLVSLVFLAFLFLAYLQSLITVIAIVVILAIELLLSMYTRKIYAFYDSNVKVVGRRGTRTIDYADIYYVRLLRGRIIMALKNARPLVVPKNPRIGQSDLYSWLQSKVSMNKAEGNETKPEGGEDTESSSDQDTL
ncbi:MAG: zinc ribbon domain-containing protein [Thermoprotei archaeon]